MAAQAGGEVVGGGPTERPQSKAAAVAALGIEPFGEHHAYDQPSCSSEYAAFKTYHITR